MPRTRILALPLIGLAAGLLGGCRDTFWSPDGRSLVVSHGGTVRILTLEGLSWTTVAAGEKGKRWHGAPAWNADGTRLGLFRADGPAPGGEPACTFAAYDTRNRTLTPFGGPLPVKGVPTEEIMAGQAEWGFHASWEPGGERAAISFRTESEADRHAVFLAAPAAPLRRLSAEGADHRWPSWGPRDAGIAVFETEHIPGAEDRIHVAILNPVTGAARRVWSGPDGWHGGLPPVWSDDGARLAVTSGRNEEDGGIRKSRLELLDASTGAVLRRVEIDGSVLGISITPDFRRFGSMRPAGKADGRDRYDLVVAPVEGGPGVTVASRVEVDDMGVPVLSPDGSRFAALYRGEDRPAYLRLFGPGLQEQSISLPQ